MAPTALTAARRLDPPAAAPPIDQRPAAGRSCAARTSPTSPGAREPTARSKPASADVRPVVVPQVQEHDHEQEQHHDGAGVDDDLHRAEEVGVQQHVDRRER